ncbi:CmpA/NrtA family ABC transporter substrate-binding protein [Thalassococcus sp. S3]|uniref:CmpA/NrtA family ABC transporter substrate-binding protein n=1 Tax=Thalassococcus sp. S3 TaxID=2017482 RepID=UPI001023FB80|nr:CmpA/NrtA family ABC transporter substrate-binding protein [Thalassococcus sp. S3]QBF30032.1 nitrate transporter [Thalassococcus sp. S3]
MNLHLLRAGFIPLVDAAPLIVAHEIGFAEEEGLALDLRKAPSWSTLRDMVALGQIEAAHMLSPVPVATALGLGGNATRLDALSVLSVNGNVVCVSRALADRMRAGGYAFDFSDPRAAGEALMKAVDGQLRIGVPFPFSMHAELLYYWLGALGVPAPQSLDVRTVPPPLMADAIAAGEVDAFCVGEPWGSIAVENGVGELLLPGSAIWSFAPEKVLAVRHDWAGTQPVLTGKLIRTLWRAGRWLSQPANRATASEILSQPHYLGVTAEILDRALSGHFVISPRGDQRQRDSFVAFHEGAATFPWRSQAQWIAQRLAARTGLDRDMSLAAAHQVFRTDLYRNALSALHVDLPGASEKVEGALDTPREIASASGTLILRPDRFFDGAVFDLSALQR